MQTSQMLLRERIGCCRVVELWLFYAVVHFLGGIGDTVLLGNQAESEPDLGVRLFEVSGIHRFNQEFAGFPGLAGLGIDASRGMQDGEV